MTYRTAPRAAAIERYRDALTGAGGLRPNYCAVQECDRRTHSYTSAATLLPVERRDLLSGETPLLGWCDAHLFRLRKYGDPEAGRPVAPYETAVTRARPGECDAPGCSDRVLARGLCSLHYYRVRRTGLLDGRRKQKTGLTECAEFHCENRHHANGLCKTHDQRRRRRLAR